MMITVLAAAAALLAGILLTWFIFYNKLRQQAQIHAAEQQTQQQLNIQLSTTAAVLEREKATLQQDKQHLQHQLDASNTSLHETHRQLAALEEKLHYQRQLYQQQKQDLEQLGTTLKKDFSLLANNILDEKTQRFNETQQKELDTLLAPLKANLTAFKEQVEKTYKTESDDRISLREQVKHMMTLNETLSKEARALTAALTGNTKKQGDWGELILESILSYSGLQKGIHYFTQETSQDEQGNRIRPDVLVKYPDNRIIIIDSKVSLVHYDQLCREQDETLMPIHLRNMQQSIRNHIDGLHSKNYSQINDSLDMVIMFMPVEAAYITALQHDPELQHYAYKKQVLLISPANLTLAMKLIYDMWKRDAIDKNAEAIAERAGKLYDKLAGFIDNFEKIGKVLGTLQGTYDDAFRQLATGRGNVVQQAEQMKQLHIKSARQIPAAYLNDAATEETQLNT
ncbi:DNA recombination protein RmuC [Deminuibacter soli]|uniref:DNA recombination protein RmuC n=1 Tax=Deminuibacter soli TaxID=2291815 RepID=A0A3E1NF09_9BACT|nr:DNA recombination protein RmuC [Deminuibacter soli]RFM26368.1 DNA recombination protein RmuC [Deminuibacter soli]